MQMIAIAIEILGRQVSLDQEVEDGDFDDFNGFFHSLTQSSSVGQMASTTSSGISRSLVISWLRGFFLFSLLFLLLVCVFSLDKLNLQYSTLSIINVS
jgi:hypothetical protein